MLPGKWCVALTTYRRPDTLQDLLEDLRALHNTYPFQLVVIEDGGSRRKNKLDLRAFDGAQTILPNVHYGKRKFSELWTHLLTHLRTIDAQHYVFLQDDVRLCSRFFEEISERWQGVPSPGTAATLNLLVDGAREHAPCWTGRDPIPVSAGLVNTGWVDGLFYAPRRTLDLLKWRVYPVRATRWRPGGPIGSGVGQQVSRRLLALGQDLYRARESLVVHTRAPSVLNPERPGHEHLDAVHFVDGPVTERRLRYRVDGVVASLTTIAGREAALERAIASLEPQVDRLVVVAGEAKRGTDEDKMHGSPPELTSQRGWFVMYCDDDLIYPADLVEVLTDKIDRYSRRIAAGTHGITLPEYPKRWLKDRKVLHTFASLGADTWVNMVATHAAMYFRPPQGLPPMPAPEPRMLDIHMGIWCKNLRMPVLCVAHDKDWFIHQDHDDTIWNWTKRIGDDVQSRLIREAAPWHVLTGT